MPTNNLEFPLVKESRLVKPRGERQVLEVEGEPNAISQIRLLRELEPARDRAPAGAFTTVGEHGTVGEHETVVEHETVGEYQLEPLTGKTHQLRVHMNSLGLPILGDHVYPVDLCTDPYDFSSPLQLLAASIGFDDPLTGQERLFESGLSLGKKPGSGDEPR